MGFNIERPECASFVEQGRPRGRCPRTARAKRVRGRRHQERKHCFTHFKLSRPAAGGRVACQAWRQCGLPLTERLHTALHVDFVNIIIIIIIRFEFA